MTCLGVENNAHFCQSVHTAMHSSKDTTLSWANAQSALFIAWIALLFSGFACFSGRRSSCKSRAIEKDGQRDSRGRCQAVDSAVQCRVVMCSSDGMVYCVQWELKLVSACGRVWRSSNVWPDRAEAEWMDGLKRGHWLYSLLPPTPHTRPTEHSKQASIHALACILALPLSVLLAFQAQTRLLARRTDSSSSSSKKQENKKAAGSEEALDPNRSEALALVQQV